VFVEVLVGYIIEGFFWGTKSHYKGVSEFIATVTVLKCTGFLESFYLATSQCFTVLEFAVHRKPFCKHLLDGPMSANLSVCCRASAACVMAEPLLLLDCSLLSCARNLD